MRQAQRSAAWLVERPLHSVLGLALTLLLPFAQIFTGAAITVLVLANGAAAAILAAAAAALVVVLTSLLTGANVAGIMINAAAYWLPSCGAAALLAKTRSLTLTLQVTAILALVATGLVYAILGDPASFWAGQIDTLAVVLRDAGLIQQADLLVSQRDRLAPMMTVLVVASAWSVTALVLVLGYWWYRQLPSDRGGFPLGRFADLDLGRVLAVAVAVTSLLALATGATWLTAVAFVGFVLYWLQGMALLHWLHVERSLPGGFLVAAYALLPFLHGVLIAAFAALGLSDAWFNYRARAERRSGE